MAHDPISDLRRYAAALEAQVSGDRSREAARSALNTPTPARSPRRAVVAIATTVLLGVSNVALATVADPAVPGDALYGVDRAYEQVGSLLGSSDLHAGERASEFLVLRERGKSSEALELVQEVLATLLEANDPEAAVREFTAGLGNDDFAQQLQSLIDAARDVDTTGREVADIARQIVDEIRLPEQARPENPGPPADRGRPTTPTPPENPGPPDDRGQPTPPTAPDNPGQGKPTETGQRGDQP